MQPYRKFNVYCRQSGKLVGCVEAESEAQAVFRLVGGAWERDDYFATAQSAPWSDA